MNKFLKRSKHAYTINVIGVASIAYDYDISLYSDCLFNELEIPFPRILEQAVDKRKAEYLAGRFAAKEALKSMGFTTKNIGTGHNRAPIWPKGIIASITHTDKSALCVAAREKHFTYLGVDLENVLSADMINKLKDMIIDHNEERLMQRIPADFSTLFTLVFSAKESIFKALHPYVQSYFDFSVAKLIGISLDTQHIQFILAKDLCKDFQKGSVLQGRFYIKKHQVLSVIYNHLIEP